MAPRSADGLLDKQRLFVQEYLVDLNAKEAAIRAGYSPRSAKQVGHELLKHPVAGPMIEAAMKDRCDRTRIDADWMLIRLAEEAEADLADLYWPDGALKPVHEWPLVWRKGLVAGVDVETLREDGEQIGRITKVKLSDRVKRLELIGKHVDVQAFREKVEHSGPNGAALVPVLNVTIGRTESEPSS